LDPNLTEEQLRKIEEQDAKDAKKNLKKMKK